MLRTRAPLVVANPFDLHVLGPPQTFALSQDQTLQFTLTSLCWCSSLCSIYFCFCLALASPIRACALLSWSGADEVRVAVSGFAFPHASFERSSSRAEALVGRSFDDRLLFRYPVFRERSNRAGKVPVAGSDF